MTRILVIESEAPSRHAMRSILEGAGYEVEVASDGTDAVQAHSRHPADLIIADLADVAPTIAFAGARVLALPGGLAARGAEAAERVRTLNALHSLPKPFRRDDLLAAVRTTLTMSLASPAGHA